MQANNTQEIALVGAVITIALLYLLFTGLANAGPFVIFLIIVGILIILGLVVTIVRDVRNNE